MSRIARKPIEIPAGVDVKLNGRQVVVKGKKGEFSCDLHDAVDVSMEGKNLKIVAKKDKHPMVGTTAKLLKNYVKGVQDGFERKLQLVGVGYRAKTQGKTLELSLGFSHPVVFDVPEGITIDVPTNTDIIIKGADPEVVGEVAAKIRAKRPPEIYKGKGVRYFGENIELKETKKK